LYSFEGIDDGKREEKAERGAELLHSLTAAGAKAASYHYKPFRQMLVQVCHTYAALFRTI
jgi:hypothetical protein